MTAHSSDSKLSFQDAAVRSKLVSQRKYDKVVAIAGTDDEEVVAQDAVELDGAGQVVARGGEPPGRLGPFDKGQFSGAGLHELLEFVEMRFIDGAGVDVVAVAERGGHPDDLAHATAGSHDADRPERDVRDADVSPRHE